MTVARTPTTIERCHACGSRTVRWLAYFCPDCGQHHDSLYSAEAPDPRPRSREEIVAEYRAVGMDAEADRLAGQPPAASRVKRPAPPTKPTVLPGPTPMDRRESA